MRWVWRCALLAVFACHWAAAPAAEETVHSAEGSFRLLFLRDGGVDYARLAEYADSYDVWMRPPPGGLLASLSLVFALPTLVNELAGIPKEALAARSEPDRVAFWINAYNTMTVDLIVREWHARKGRLKSIKEIPSPWSRPKWTVAGRSVSLDEVEHDILRKEFHEPRIHFALVCASKSCPALRSLEFRGDSLDAQLDSAAREFVLDPSRNDFTPRDGAIRISKIFDWYGKDFVGVYSDPTFERIYGREMGAVLAYVARFLPAETVAALRTKRARVKYLPYDWSLNVAPSP